MSNVQIIFYDGIAPTGKLIVQSATMNEVRQVLFKAGYNGNDFSLSQVKSVEFEKTITFNQLALGMAFSNKGTVNDDSE